MSLGVVVIGRNEGDRLKRCLQSVVCGDVVYVDSGSTDGSVAWVRDRGIEVIELEQYLPFTAGRARNAGLRRLRERTPKLDCVQFVDGDCELVPGWLKRASSFLQSHPDVAALCGRLKERHPEQSVYNWLCDREWDGPAGEIVACGGVFMARMKALDAVVGFRDDMIAGEEPELCLRLRAAGWRVWRRDTDMALHDAAMMRFGQWWRRAVRAGYACALGAALHGKGPEQYNVWESRRAWIWGVGLPLVCLAATVLFWPWGLAAWLIYPLQLLRQTMRNTGSLKARSTMAVFQLLARFPEAWGQMKFMADRLAGRQRQLIEHK